MALIGIYKLTNKINNKIYIGQSWNIDRGWSDHRTYSNQKTTHLYRSFRKYGIENFNFEKAATGRVFSPETKAKMSEKKAGVNSVSVIARKVRCIETNVEYISKRAAAKAISPDNFQSVETGIAHSCYDNRNRRIAKGFHWEYI
jgi:predicted GIY-YIG superfamily endonuclease